MPTPRVGRRTAMVMVGALAATGALAVGVGYLTGAAGSPVTPAAQVTKVDRAQSSAVEAAFSAAVRAGWSVGAPADASPTPDAAQSSGTATIPTGGAQPNLLSEAEQSLPKYFTHATATTETTAMRSASQRSPNYQITGGGVTKVTFAHIAVANPTAVLQADVTAWWKTQSRGTPAQAWHVTTHHATMQYTATLERGKSGHWMVRLIVADCISACS